MEGIKIAAGENQREKNDCITVDEIAKRLSIARVTAYQLTKTEGFPCFYIGRRIIIPLNGFDTWVNKQVEAQSTVL